MTEGTPDEIFLNDESIANWKHPVAERNAWMSNPYGSTILLSSLGSDTLNKKIGKYRIMAATARFSAEVRRINFRNTGDHLPAQEEILSSGGITILEDGDIPGANFSGYDLRRVGKIWTASAGEEKSLHEIILGIEPSEYEARVDAILRGYEKQEEAEQSRQDFNRGLRSWTT